MLTLSLVFAASFVFIAIAGAAVAWGIQARAELKAWKTKHGRFIARENDRAWQANREMIVY
jgi:hypothetical protein